MGMGACTFVGFVWYSIRYGIAHRAACAGTSASTVDCTHLQRRHHAVWHDALHRPVVHLHRPCRLTCQRLQQHHRQCPDDWCACAEAPASSCTYLHFVHPLCGALRAGHPEERHKQYVPCVRARSPSLGGALFPLAGAARSLDTPDRTG
jgi:hypothetical protein